MNNPKSNISINQLSRLLDISVGSTHQILKEFETEDIVLSEPAGNSIIYHINFNNTMTRKLVDELRSNEPQENVKKTKIVCTIGPSTDSVAMIRKLIENGADVIRINSSHCTEQSMLELISNIRKANEFVPILIDIPGVKVRLDKFNGEFFFKKGDILNFCSNKKEGCIPVDHDGFHNKMSKGAHFSMDDGTVGFAVEKIEGDIISCIALNDGAIKGRKGINVPGLNLGGCHLTPVDKKLITFAIKNKVNFIGISFIKSAQQVEKINELMKGTDVKLISKIETQEAIDEYPQIIEKSYAIMIDRGDLGAEVGLERIPRLQKKIINECNYQGKPIIIATQMLDSMRISPYPTKSEITDVANAVLDGASALMLSAETAVGKYPLETASTMRKIISDIEGEVKYRTFEDNISRDDFTDVMGAAVAKITNLIKIDKIVCITSGGYSARMLARHKLPTWIIAATDNPRVASIMNLVWGVMPFLVNIKIDNSGSVEQKRKIVMECLDNGLIEKEDTILILGAVFPNNRKITNMIELHKVREFIGYFKEAEKK
ncbi:MAG: pyruvate kinase [Nanoarchaeota archaeon]|nr:pyruvate kinase [Nanoarchaeota archaeon]MBU1005584.1 pyruvate kinase [Nanoarchaeota archaeon]MBU1945970.1 pyruvate kinase [Nanoarchaeota archaeon]